MTRTSILAVVIALTLPAAGCIFSGPTFEHDPGPGPSDDISTSVAPEGTGGWTTTVGCDGPEDELALLGSLCGSSQSFPTWNGHVGDQSVALWGTEGGAVLLVLGYHTQELPEGEYDHTADIRYAAYVVLEPPASDEGTSGWESTRRLMRAWPEGEALTGEIVTERAVATACGTDFVGSATLLWRETTITVTWAASLPC